MQIKIDRAVLDTCRGVYRCRLLSSEAQRLLDGEMLEIVVTGGSAVNSEAIPESIDYPGLGRC